MNAPALLDRPAATTAAPLRHLRPLPQVPAAQRPATPALPAAAQRPAPAATAPAPAATPAPAAAPKPNVAPRGFALYVGLDELKAAADGVTLPILVEALRRTISELAPSAETYAAVALAPQQAGGRDVDVVRLALHEPGAVARTKTQSDEQAEAAKGVVVDISRKRVVIDGESANLTFKEFELLQYLVLREGRTIDRGELVSSLWDANDAEAPGERTIDVHVRRLRSKLGAFQDIVRTVRGVGYRFDRHADVAVRYGAGAPSPDRF